MHRRTLIAGMVALALCVPAVSRAADTEALMAQIQALLAQISALQQQLRQQEANGTGSTSAGSCVTITDTLALGSSGSQVTALQNFLIGKGLITTGRTTGYFGPLTESAVQQWQASRGIVTGGTPATTGYGAVGPKTRASFACSSPIGVTPSSIPGSSQAGGSTAPAGTATGVNVTGTGMTGSGAETGSSPTVSSVGSADAPSDGGADPFAEPIFIGP